MTDDKTKAKIAHELYEAVRKLDANSGLLCIIGSYGDTVDDEEVLERLRQWNHDSEEKAVKIEVTRRVEPVPALS
ncbi:hypothetical protein [Mesorhizobium sp. IMUNJ 23232]|uniref:hypothetical protein n=1 Tax=Mesorhizobium sp. IMUNJ 23232 TaxID=3376064 RepID=UPI0037AF502F